MNEDNCTSRPLDTDDDEDPEPQLEPLVVNSVLCYLYNKRRRLTDADLRSSAETHFSPLQLDAAYELLVKRLPPAAPVGGASTVDAILRTFDACERRNWTLPRFAVVDIDDLPQAPAAGDQLLLAHILRELKNVKQIVEQFGEYRDKLTSSSSGGAEPFNPTVLGTPSPAAVSPAPSSGSPLGNMSTRKRGNSRGIEDAVAKIKAIRSEDGGRRSSDSCDDASPKEEAPTAPAPVVSYPNSTFGAAFSNFLSKQQQLTISPTACSMSAALPCFGAPFFASPFDSAALLLKTANNNIRRPKTPTSPPLAAASFIHVQKNNSKLPRSNLPLCQNAQAMSTAKSGSTGIKCEPSSGETFASHLSTDSSGDSTYKPYVCQHANCNKRFANKFLLKKHEFIHTGERPHQCTYCCKRFNRKDNLLRHKKTHEANYSLVRRRSRHLFGVKDGDDAPLSISLPPNSNNAATAMDVSPRSASASDEGSSDNEPAMINNGTTTAAEEAKHVFNTFFDQQQQAQLAAALNAYKAAAVWSSHAAGVSSSD